MQTLGMSGGKFEITIKPVTAKRFAYGLDQIEFTQISQNSGQMGQQSVVFGILQIIRTVTP